MSTFVMNYVLVGLVISSNIYSNSIVLSILYLMDGQLLLSHHTLDLLLFGMPMEKSTM